MLVALYLPKSTAISPSVEQHADNPLKICFIVVIIIIIVD